MSPGATHHNGPEAKRKGKTKERARRIRPLKSPTGSPFRGWTASTVESGNRMSTGRRPTRRAKIRAECLKFSIYHILQLASRQAIFPQRCTFKIRINCHKEALLYRARNDKLGCSRKNAGLAAGGRGR